MATSCQGFLRKNHQSQQFGQKNNRRYFVTEGFAVTYYETENRKKTKGHFDLRNVLTLRPAPDEGVGDGAVELNIAEERSTVKVKRLVVSFSSDPDKRSTWLKLWCSAITPDGVDPALKGFRDAAVARNMELEYGATRALSMKSSIFRSPSTTAVLTPRGTAAPTSSDDGQLDTPRERSGALPAPPTKPEGPPPAPVSQPTKPIPEEDEVTFEITVPDNVQPGDKLQATTPSGVKVKLAVPPGAEPGTILTFALPASVGGEDKQVKAAVLIQARMRGAKSRSSIMPGASDSGSGSARSPIKISEKPQLELAALKVQKTFRGHTARNDQQEASRLQWMAYYMQPEVGEWEEALALAVTEEEEEKIRATKMGIEYEEEKRVKWFKWYVSNGEFDRAAELVVTEVEAAVVLKSRATAPAKCCVCLAGGGGGGGAGKAIEEERYQRFVQAIRAYQWNVAEVLAVTPEEASDVADSKMRVNAMEAAIAMQDKARALEYAITTEERARVQKLKDP